MPDLRLASVTGLFIAVWLTWQMYRRSGARLSGASVDLPCLVYQRALLERERDLAVSLPRWYLVPVVAGQVAIAATLATSPRFTTSQLYPEGLVLFIGTAGVVLVVIWRRWQHQAMALQRELEAISVSGVLLLAAFGLFALGGSAAAQTAAPPTFVEVDGHKLNVRLSGPANPGAPTVVFESGLGAPIHTWSSVPSAIAATTRTVAYERAGIGTSEPGPEPRSIKQIVAELHALLAKLDVPPPYVLVGHSWGGPVIHSFAATYPKEIAGLVYVDPSDFTQTEADILAVWQQSGAKDGRNWLRQLQEHITESAPAGVKAEFRELDRMERGGFAELRAAGDPPDVPVVFLVAGQPQLLPPTATFPGDYDRFFQANLERRLHHLSRLAQRASKGTLVHTSKSGHFIHATEPDLVVWAIQRVLASAQTHPELERFVGEYVLAPTFSITITRDGDKLFAQATGQPAFHLQAESATRFSLKVVDAQLEFEVDLAGNVAGLVLAQNGRRLPGTKQK
jgi:pimeloyl-ACP methyl ester carboxylesterase